MSADPADYPADGGRAEYGWREQDPHGRPGGDAPPGAVAGRRLVLVLVHLAASVLGDYGRVIGPDQSLGVQFLDDLVVILGGGLVLEGAIPRGAELSLCFVFVFILLNPACVRI